MRWQLRTPQPGSAWIEPIASSVGAQVLVTDDADGFKSVADQTGRLASSVQEPCQAQTEERIDEMRPLVATDQDGSF